MDYAFTPEQVALRDAAREALTDRGLPESAGPLADSDPGWDPSSWPALAAMGWTGLATDPDAGFVDEAILFEETGHALYPGPFFSTVALAVPSLIAGRELLTAVADGTASATLAWAETGGVQGLLDVEGATTRISGDGRVSGTKVRVPDVGIVTHVVVAGRGDDGVALALVDLEAASGRATVTVHDTVDTTRRLGTLVLDEAPGTLLASGGDAHGVLVATRRRALAAAAAEAVGVGRRMLDVAAAHARVREQFGRVIGTYQAVSHRIADSYVDVELARSLALRAAWSVQVQDELPPGEVDLAVAMAAARAGTAAVQAAEAAIQVLGGIGMTWEHVAHRFYKRALWLASFEGSAARHRAAVAAAVLDGVG